MAKDAMKWTSAGENLETACDGGYVYFRSAIKEEYPVNSTQNYRVATTGAAKMLPLPDGRVVRCGINLSIDRPEEDLSPAEAAQRNLAKAARKAKK